MPTKELLPFGRRLKLAAVTLGIAALAQAARAQTDDTTPFYAGASLGVSHVSNVYREADTPNSDTVVSYGLLAGLDQRLGRQHLTFDASLQNNRYSSNRDLNYRSHSLRGALNWQTAGNLTGVLSAKSDRSLADFNIGNLVEPFFKKNIERNDDYRAVGRLGMGTRYSLESGWQNRRRTYSAEEYDSFEYRQNTGWLGAYAIPGGNVRLGLVGRRTKGTNPRYATNDANNPFAPNDYTRDDIDFTTNWSAGGHTTLNGRISRSKSRNSVQSASDFHGTTGALGGNWQPTGKLQFNFQYARDTGQETTVVASDMNRIYTSWQFGSSYVLSGKITLTGRISDNRTRRNMQNSALIGGFEGTKAYNIGLRWAIYRGFSLGCQYDHVTRDSNIQRFSYTANSYGCTGQALVY
ncbi:MAG: hypothetical protein EOO64_00145 [Massilia sp.]|nr:MAG: hypothetical protein EOO64_00145 [Massilia sp.]